MTVCHMLLGRPWQYDKKATHDGHTNVYSFKVNEKTFVLRPMTPNQIIADNAKAIARAQEERSQHDKRNERGSHQSEKRDEIVNHQNESERHKPKVSLLATKSEMREIQDNPTIIH